MRKKLSVFEHCCAVYLFIYCYLFYLRFGLTLLSLRLVLSMFIDFDIPPFFLLLLIVQKHFKTTNKHFTFNHFKRLFTCHVSRFFKSVIQNWPITMQSNPPIARSAAFDPANMTNFVSTLIPIILRFERVRNCIFLSLLHVLEASRRS